MTTPRASDPRRAVPDRILELFALGELPDDEARALEERMRQDADLAARLAALRASDREILARHPPAAVAREVRRRIEAERPGRWRLALAVTAPALAGALALALLVRPVAVERDEGGERIKGARPQLIALMVRGGQAEQLADGALVAPGDAIQLASSAAGLSQGVIVSIDGRGGVTLHWPEDPREPARLQAGGHVVLPHAFQLDDAPGFERFILVAAAEPVDVVRVVEAARALARSAAPTTGVLDLPRTWTQSSIELRKAQR